MTAWRRRERPLTAGKDRQQRGVAQLGRALALGARCRRFKSCHLDQSSPCRGNFMSVSKLHSHTPLGTASEPPATRHRGGSAGIVYRLRRHPSKVKKRFRPPLPAPYVAVAELAYASVSNTLFSGFDPQRQHQMRLWRNWQTQRI